MYIRANLFLSLKSKIPGVACVKKMSRFVVHQKTTNTDLYVYIQVLLTNMQFTAKITFFSGLRFFN